ncbi:hypothetical protein [Psychrobacillus sp. L3]|uniref:hypothetical protein n=1 Tax=Psychrobacillus sp. L3 TaxID=3236891 RepID=UPI0036F44436
MMTKNYALYGLIALSIILTISGFIQLLNSIENAIHSANDYISTGGSAETFIPITNGYIATNVTKGGIMFFVGLIFLCVSILNLSKKLN